MISFFISLMRLLAAIRQGIKKDQEFRALLYLLLTLLTAATVFYWRNEGWSLIDSLYFSVMTMSTIGYGDFVPTSTLSKLFTIVYALLSIGVFVAVVSKLVSIILQQRRYLTVKSKRFVSSHGLKHKSKPVKSKAKKTGDDTG
ncbi:MAG: potassium channel family protein [Gammaproteobacteria bacterium]